MIYVNCAAQQDDIINMLENYEGDIKFKYVGKKGIKIAFEVTTEDLDLAINQAKTIIKESKIGKALYFQVVKWGRNMEKWGLAICGLGLFLIMISSSSTPTNLILIGSGLFYVVLGAFLIVYKKKKENRGTAKWK